MNKLSAKRFCVQMYEECIQLLDVLNIELSIVEIKHGKWEKELCTCKVGGHQHGSLNRRDLRPGMEAVFEPGGTFLDFRSKLPPNGKYQNGERKSYPRTADFT